MAEHEYPSAAPTEPERDSDSDETDSAQNENNLFEGGAFQIFNDEDGGDFTGHSASNFK